MDHDSAWTGLEAAARADGAHRIVDLFADDPDRLRRLTLTAAGLSLDLSKHPWSRAGLEAGLVLARAADVERHRDRLFAGDEVNTTEHRPALHMALRAPDGASFRALGRPVSAEVEATRAVLKAFAEDIRGGKIVGATG